MHLIFFFTAAESNKAVRVFLLLCGCVLFSLSAEADLKTWTLTPEVVTAGSIPDRVLWNLRAGISGQWESAFFDSDSFTFHLDAKLRADKQERFVSTDEYYEFRVNKAYLQWQGNRASFSLGLQRYTWGDSAFFDGVDFVNPRDLTEPLYADDESVKLPVPSVNLQYLGANTIFQTILTLKPARTPVAATFNGIDLQEPVRRVWFSDPELALKAGGLLKNGWDINGYLLSYFERVPQPVLVVADAAKVADPSGRPAQPSMKIRLNEPRVFTLGITATQSAGDFVFRTEAALHSGRALPDVPSQVSAVSDQFVFHGSTDVTLFKNMVTTFELWTEHWFAKSGPNFDPDSQLMGIRMMKPFFEGQLEPSAGGLLAADAGESWSFLKLTLKVFDGLQLGAEAHWVETSTGRVLARRRLKNLIRSSLSYQF
jgi:hypothetical protein